MPPGGPDTYRSGLNFEAMDSLLARMQLLWRHDYAEAGIGSPLGWGVASWTDSSAVLKWKPRGTRRLAGYRIERTLDTAGSDICRTDLPSDDSVATDRGLDRGSTYYYRIASVNQRDGTIGPPSCWINVLPDRPKIPRDLTARRGNRQIMLSWQSPLDTNVVNHRVYRENTGDGWDLIGESNVGSYTDQGVVNDTVYHYRITAVSRLGNESDPAGPVRGIAFAFDGLPLILDGTRSGPTALTDKDSVRAVWERLLEPLGAEYRDANPQTTNRFGLDVYGPHQAVVVVSDGRGALETSLIPQLGLYTYAGGALVISGRDLFNIPQLADGTMNFKPGAFAYDVLGITAAYYPSVLLSDPTRMNAQFAAALSADPDLPNLDVDPERTAWGLNPALPDPGSVIPFVGYFDIDTARARVLYTFESNCGDKSPLDGRPVAVISKDPDHPAAAFSFPLSYIREDLARRAILAVLGQLGWSTPIAGDANNDGRVDAADCLRLMNCLFRGAALRNLTHVDLNGDCEVNVVDLAILIDYTLHAGVLLESGCAVSGR
ncbi:MAG: hypothetical protein HY304_02210 [candidate division Zixibacteria bacterium]|nr:hypothetical protein [candidate division Zixibacteria bacterium]